MSGNLPATKVYFRWASAEVKQNEEVRVVGSCPELGSWQPSEGWKLHRDRLEPECWTSNGIALTVLKQVQYKYVICSTTSPDVRWEERTDNHVVVPTGRKHIVEDDLGRFRNVPVTNPRGAGDKDMYASNSPGLPRRMESFEETVKREEQLQVSDSDHVFAVLRTLPVMIRKSATGKWQVEEDDTIAFKVVSMIKRSLPEGASKLWFVGHPGVFTSDVEEQKQITEVLAAHKCIPVFIDEQVNSYALEFCHTFLWPVMHNMKVFDDEASRMAADGDGNQKFDETTWKNYRVFNQAYASAVENHMSSVSAENVLVWVHDFYLLLVPRAIRLRCANVSVGFFLHSAFPSSEVMRCIPPREEILTSLLNCKVVTFQIFEYARHFLSCCQLLLNSTYRFQGAGELYIEHDSESILVRADHFVVPFKDFVKRMDQPQVVQQAAALRKKFGDRLIFASIDGDEPFSGMILKLRAFQKFLSECPQHVQKVGLLQHVLSRRTSSKNGDSELLREVKRMAEETNKEFGQQGRPLVVIEEGDVTVDDRLALFKAADVSLDTSINDGLNLHPFLFCIAHSTDQDQHASIICSEFSGCSSVLIGASKVNPWNTQAVMDTMHQVVTMEPEDRARKFKQDHTYVSTMRLREWVRQNLAEIKQVHVKASGPVKGLGAGSRLLFMERGFRHLSAEVVLHDYRAARTRVILLDNEGTLAPDRRSAVRPYGAQELRRMGHSLDEGVLDCLKQLAADRQNTVLVISGRGRKEMDQWFGGVKDLGLCAEHGFYWVPPGKGTAKTGDPNRWKCMQETSFEDDDWKDIAKQLIQQYVKRIQGSVLEFKGSAVAWNYRKVGAQVLANEIALELTRFLDPKNGPESLMYGYPVVVVNGKGYVEVKRSDVDKGVAVKRVLTHLRERLGSVDFVLCIGDDRSDEDMFEVVNELRSRGSGTEDDLGGFTTEISRSRVGTGWSSSGPTKLTKKASLTLEEFDFAEMSKSSKYYTVTVGRKPSKAGYFLKDVQEVSDLLQKLTFSVRGLARFSSMPMLKRPEDDSDSD